MIHTKKIYSVEGRVIHVYSIPDKGNNSKETAETLLKELAGSVPISMDPGNLDPNVITGVSQEFGGIVLGEVLFVGLNIIPYRSNKTGINRCCEILRSKGFTLTDTVC